MEKSLSIKSSRLFGLVVVALIAQTQECEAAGIRVIPPDSGYKNGWGLGLSYGQGISKNSWLWGWSTDYSRVLVEDGRWVMNVSLSWDRDTEKKPEEDSVTETYSLAASVGRRAWRNMYLGFGFGKGLYEKEVKPQKGSWKRVNSDKDWSTGIFLSGDIWSSGRYDISPTVTLEYSITDNQWSWSADLGWSMAF